MHVGDNQPASIWRTLTHITPWRTFACAHSDALRLSRLCGSPITAEAITVSRPMIGNRLCGDTSPLQLTYHFTRCRLSMFHWVPSTCQRRFEVSAFRFTTTTTRMALQFRICISYLCEYWLMNAARKRKERWIVVCRCNDGKIAGSLD